ncbi:MAG: hypothetical protein WCQ70_02870 [Lentimicrobiaceae bacterium]
MELKLRIISTIIVLSLIACNNQSEEKAEQAKLDSIRIADSITFVLEKERVIDSIQAIADEQQIISDSIQNQVSN